MGQQVMMRQRARPAPAESSAGRRARAPEKGQADRRHHHGGLRRRLGRLRGVVGVAVAIAVWAVVTATNIVSPRDVPTIGAVAAALAGSWQQILTSLGTTVAGLFLGLGVAAVAGGVLGLLAGLSEWADAFTDVIVRMMRPLPSLALIPIAILVAGLGLRMTLGLVAFAAFWPIFINTRYATHSIEPAFLDTGRSLGFGRLEQVWRVVVPAVAPAYATGVRISAGIAIAATISVEMVAGTGGLGGYVLSAEQGGATAQMYAGILVGGVLGWLLNVVLAGLTRFGLAWEVAVHDRGEA